MKNYSKLTPEGTKDLLFEESVANEKISETLASVYHGRGFNKVSTPGIEFYDVFAMPEAAIPMENMFKFSDSKGRLVVVRPDSTLPIARMTATRLKNEPYPIRLYYTQRVYISNPGLTGRSNEIMQSGIELIGAKGKRADLEVITTATQALKKLIKRKYISDFRLELGHAGFFKALIRKLNVTESEREDIRSFIEAKNYSALNSMLDNLQPSKAVEAIRRLPRLFGGAEVLDEASALCEDEESRRPLEYLKEIFNDLKKCISDKQIMIDLGLVQRNDYYSDIVFSGYVEGSGEPVLVGGRYDRLLENFGRPAPSSGFAINVNALASIMIRDKNKLPKHTPQILVYGEEGYETAAVRFTQSLLEDEQSPIGTQHRQVIAENSVADTYEDALQYAKTRGIHRIAVVGEEIKWIEV